MAAILMIDDERAILELVKNGLQKDGHFVTTYTSAAQVPLDKLNRYDLIMQSGFAADNLEDVFLSMVEKDNMDRKQRAKL